MTIPGEGVIKFSVQHQQRALNATRYQSLACTLIAWREILAMTHLVGQDPGRYDGAGYGNVSGRIGAPAAARGARSFLITGTQTSGLRNVSLQHFSVVRSYDYGINEAASMGLVQPSSESLTHGAIYDISPAIRFVMHAHAPVIWRQAKGLSLPTTASSAEYGSRQMAHEVQRLYRSSALPERRILAMGGHKDGVIVFGKNAEETAHVLLTTLAQAYQRRCEDRCAD